MASRPVIVAIRKILLKAYKVEPLEFDVKQELSSILSTFFGIRILRDVMARESLKGNSIVVQVLAYYESYADPFIYTLYRLESYLDLSLNPYKQSKQVQCQLVRLEQSAEDMVRQFWRYNLTLITMLRVLAS